MWWSNTLLSCFSSPTGWPEDRDQCVVQCSTRSSSSGATWMGAWIPTLAPINEMPQDSHLILWNLRKKNKNRIYQNEFLDLRLSSMWDMHFYIFFLGAMVWCQPFFLTTHLTSTVCHPGISQSWVYLRIIESLIYILIFTYSWTMNFTSIFITNLPLFNFLENCCNLLMADGHCRFIHFYS